MRLLDEGHTARSIRNSVALTCALALGACGIVGGGGPDDSLPVAAASGLGPSGDYPLVVGNPYTVEGVTYTPEDVLNYDQVGYLAADAGGANRVSGAHHTLPLPSYVEITSLATGRTIVVRLERRGPLDRQELVALSPGALAQLEAAAGTPVRVRRVNPPEDQRALLRAGQPAEPRMDTPMSLVEILKRKLPGQGTPPVMAQAQPVPAVAAPSPEPARVAAASSPQTARASTPPALPPLSTRGTVAVTVPATAVSQDASSGFAVQAASFSTADRARSAARTLEGEVSQSGAYFRVRTGPFATRAEAEASLAKVRAAGYRDARIQTSG